MKSLSTRVVSAWQKRVTQVVRHSVITIGAIGWCAMSTAYGDVSKLSADLEKALNETSNPQRVLVLMKQPTALPMAMTMQMTSADVERLIKKRVLENQTAMREYVSGQSSGPSIAGDSPISRYKFFWTVNALMAIMTPEAISEVAERDDVVKVFLDKKLYLERDFRQLAEEGEEGEFTYGLQKIGVPELREKFPKLNGNGITVGIIDTGIDAAHAELKDKSITFKDFVGNKKDPYDDNGHGTHVAGTIAGTGVGGTQLGVAPNVKLIIAKVFSARGSANVTEIVRAMEWMADPDGNPDTKDQPKVINNSWGGGLDNDITKDPFFLAVNTWVQLDIFPSFAAGNSGPSASSVGAPGGFPNAFAVGATDANDSAANFSSRGPVDFTLNGKKVTLTKPEVSAPGVQVYSSMPGGRYAKMSGTSMATPHTTGVIAVMYGAKPDLKVIQVKQLLMGTSHDLGQAGMDNTYGSGRINVLDAVEKMSSAFELF